MFAQLEAHSQSPCCSNYICTAKFVSHLRRFKMLCGAKRYYTEYLLGIEPLFRVVFEIRILLGLVQGATCFLNITQKDSLYVG